MSLVTKVSAPSMITLYHRHVVCCLQVCIRCLQQQLVSLWTWRTRLPTGAAWLPQLLLWALRANKYGPASLSMLTGMLAVGPAGIQERNLHTCRHEQLFPISKQVDRLNFTQR
jgi:hypothetical protein